MFKIIFTRNFCSEYLNNFYELIQKLRLISYRQQLSSRMPLKLTSTCNLLQRFFDYYSIELISLI